MEYIDDIDEDYEEYGREEEMQKQLMKTIKGLEQRTLYTSNKTPPDTEFLRYEPGHDLVNINNLNAFFQKNNMATISLSLNSQCSFICFKDKGTILSKYSPPLDPSFRDKEGQLPNLISSAKVPPEGLAQGVSSARKSAGQMLVEYPQTAIGYVEVQFSDSVTARGSGCMVGPNHVLTSAHLLHSQAYPGKKILKVRFLPGLRTQKTAFKEVDVARGIVLEKFKNLYNKPTQINQAQEYDIAILILSEPLGLSTGYLGLLSTEKLDSIKGLEIHGYPIEGNNEDDSTTVQQISAIKNLSQASVSSQFLQYESSGIASGMNGGPIVFSTQTSATEKEYYVLGVHQCGIDKNGPGSCRGVSLNKMVIKEVRDIIERSFLKTSFVEQLFSFQMKNLNSLSIQFSESKEVTSNELQQWVNALNHTPLGSLNTLTLKTKTFHAPTPILTDSVLITFSQALKKLLSLSTLKLEFYESSLITDSSAKSLANSLTSLPCKLTTFSLQLSSATQLSSQALQEIFKVFTRLEFLEDMNLLLANILKCDDDSIYSLAKSICSLQDLKVCKLHFESLPLITELSFQKLLNQLKGLEVLSKLSIVLLGFIFGENFKKQLKSSLGHIKSLSII